MKYVWKGSEYTSASLENTNNPRKVAHTKITTKTSAMKVVFTEGGDKIWKFQKNI